MRKHTRNYSDRTVRDTRPDSKRSAQGRKRDADRRAARRAKYTVQGR